MIFKGQRYTLYIKNTKTRAFSEVLVWQIQEILTYFRFKFSKLIHFKTLIFKLNR